jgi:hypothetical protein
MGLMGLTHWSHYWLLVTGYWLLVTGYWLLVTGYWLLVTGYWLLVTLDRSLSPLSARAGAGATTNG